MPALQIATLIVAIQADGRLPRSRHTRTFAAPVQSIYAADNSSPPEWRISVDSSKGWTTPEPIKGGPERALWDNLYNKILDSKHFPTIEIAVPELAHPLPDTIQQSVKVRIRGVVFNATCTGSSDGTRFSVKCPLSLPTFGIPKFKVLAGMMWVEDDIVIEVHGSLTP